MGAKIKYIEVDGSKIPVIFEKDTRLPLVNMQFVFTNSGSVTDTKKAGLAKLSAKLLNQGTQKEGAVAFAQMLEEKAIYISAVAGKETFVIEASSLKEEFDDTLSYFHQLLDDPNLTQETLEKIKTMTIGSLMRKAGDFDYVASTTLKSILFEGTVLAQPSRGSVESVKSITLEDIQTFLSHHITQSNLIIVLGGDVNFKDIKEKIKNIIKDFPKGKKEPLKKYNTIKTPKEKIIRRNTKQAYIYFGSPYYMDREDEDYYKARVAMFILGSGGFGSRLMEEIRVKKGLAYSAYARVSVTHSSSYMSGYLQTKIDSMEDAKKTVNDVIANFVKNGVTQEELDQTKKFLLGSEPLRVETLNQKLYRSFQEYYNNQPLGSSQKELQKIKNLSLDALNKFIKSHSEITQLSYSIVTK
ncbi:Zinc protease-like protein [hydrothermal vent metagenome]